jgi:poly-gamma-glutamate synthesis protein (capsule biosynthesis protein)
MAGKDVTLYFVGDVGPKRGDPDSIFRYVRPVLSQADIAFCQLEPNLSQRGTRLPQARLAMRTDPRAARAIRNAGFHVLSFASNHCMDWGSEAFLDTLNALQEQNLRVIGAGRNIEEARRPAFFECQGTRIAFLAYNSILPFGYWAEIDRPGCVPMRAWTVYEQIEHDQPGTPCRIHTLPHQGDLKAMIRDIRNAKSQADVVIVSMHWGIHFVPAVIAEYQREIGHTAIDSGADVIIGHHAHILKGIEVYRGKVIFYSLANFALEEPGAFAEGSLNGPGHKELKDLYASPESDSDLLSSDTRKTLIAKCTLGNRAIQKVSVLPTVINSESQPEVLTSTDQRFGEVVKYVEDISRDQGLNARFVIKGDEVIIDQQ